MNNDPKITIQEYAEQNEKRKKKFDELKVRYGIDKPNQFLDELLAITKREENK